MSSTFGRYNKFFFFCSGIAPLEADFKGPNTTAEGDYVVLALQTARFLLKSIDAAKRSDPLPGTTTIFAPLRDSNFDPSKGAGKPIAPEGLASVLCGDDARSRASAAKYLVDLFAYRSLARGAKMDTHYRASFQEAQKRGDTDPVGRSRAENARSMQTSAICHVRYFMLSKFFQEVDDAAAAAAGGKEGEGDKRESGETPEKRVLHRLAVMYALSDVVGLVGSGPSWGGLLTSYETDAFEYASDKLLGMLRPDVIPLVDAFDISDTVLNSALGSSDGRVYEKLYEAARSSAMNVDELTGRRVEVPECLMSVEKYLNRDFLKNGRDSSANIAAAAAPGGGGGGGAASKL